MTIAEVQDGRRGLSSPATEVGPRGEAIPDAEGADFRALIEAAHEAVAVIATDGRVVYANQAYRRLFRHSGEATGFSYEEQFVPAARVVLEREVFPALGRGESWEGVLEAQDHEGRRFPLWQRAGVVRSGSGRPRFYFAFMHDHSGQRTIEDDLSRSKEAAERASQAKTRFLAAASHDLRQPLQALGMFVAVLAHRTRSDADREIIGKIQDSLAAVEGLLNGLLDISKLEAGLVEAVEHSFPLRPMMERLASEFEPLAAASGLGLTVLPADVSLRSDPALLERILRNLLSNAIRYTRSGRILFGCRRRGGHVRLEVWDTGPGIPQDQLAHIFREFHQLANPNRDRRQGLGLGLAIVERLASLLKTRVEVRSQVGKGSVFSLEIPVAGSPRVREKPHQLSLAIARPGTVVAVIEDEPDVLDSIRMLLESWGFDPIAARDCDEVLERLCGLGKMPEIVIADYRLANGLTGGQAIARIRARLRTQVPAIILTGDTAPERLRLARANGHSLLHKPVHPDQLRSTIDLLLSQPRQQPALGQG